MKIPDWLAYAVLKTILWLNPLAVAAGLAISVWAWAVTRKFGYLLVAVFFLLVAFRWSAPTIIRMVSTRSAAPTALTPQQTQEYTREMTAVDKRFFPSGHPIVQTIQFPLGSLLLVAGLLLVARRDVRRRTGQTDPSVPGPSGGPV